MISVNKVCIFCGREFRGQKKSFEHIIPRWLVEEADLSRRNMEIFLPHKNITMGMGKIGTKVCVSCNEDGSVLEAKAKQAFQKINADTIISSIEIYDLMNWMDKVRIGMWLWMILHLRDRGNMKPKFFINNRVAAKDRIIAIKIFPQDKNMKGLAFIGINEHFINFPSVFGILANNILLTSISADFVLSRQLLGAKFTITPNFTGPEAISMKAQNQPSKKLPLIGDSNIFGQILLPSEWMMNLGVAAVRESFSAPGWSEGEITSLNGHIGQENCQNFALNRFTGDAVSSCTLSEFNIINATQHIIESYKSDVTSGFITQEKDMVLNSINNHLEGLRLKKSSIANKYRILTGVILPYT